MSQLLILRHLRTLQQTGLTAPVLLKQQHKFHIKARHLQRLKPNESSGALQESRDRGQSGVSTDVRPLGEKIKENTKTASYTAIILAGIGVTGIMFYAIFRELFSSSSPNNIYSKALERVKEDPRVQDSLGAPIKGFGEESRRGRRQHVAHSSYDRNGVPHMRMQFYVQGIRNKATVQLEARKNESGKMEYRYLFVQLDYYPHTTIVLEDNRIYDQQPPKSSASLQDWNSSGLSLSSFDKK